ncbi:MAG: DNA repair protein RecO [Tepidiforma sp.]|nr:MAG: DNA repair protein RecO [Tepidiforma sp.]
MAGRPPRTIATEAIVLRRRPIGEADAVLTLLTLAEGRVDAVARGIRKPQAKLRGHLEPVTRSRLMLARGRSLDVVAQAETVDAYLSLKGDLDALAVALYCCELTELAAPAQTPQLELFHLLANLLSALDAGVRPASAARYFELHLLSAAGYELQVACCASCGSELAEAESLFSAAAGGILCPSCRAGATGRLLSVRAQKVLRYCGRSGLEEFCALRMPTETDAEVRAALGEAVRTALDAEPRAAKFLDQLGERP